MTDPAVILEKLSAFSRMLRLEGLLVGPQETADACKILMALGFEDREQVKTALRTVYAKSREEQLTFDRTFDGFFVSLEEIRRQGKEQMEREALREEARQEAQERLQVNGQPMDLTEEQLNAYTNLSREQRQRLEDFREKFKDSAERNPKLYGGFIHSVFAKALLEQQMRMEDAAVGCAAADPEIGLMYRDISQFKDTEIPRAISIIQTVSRTINGELASKRKRAGHSGALNFRRTIRKGLETGGSFYRLQYRKKRNRRKNLTILCDVSGSMMQFSEFALRFIQSLNQVSESSRVFLFSEEIFEADAFCLQNMSRFRDYVRQCGVYGKGTDLGTALQHLCSQKVHALNPATTLIILSDTKTIDHPRAMGALLEARRQAGRVIWLNPIPETQWPYIRSVQTMAALCPMVSCSTLSALAAACRRLTR